MLDNLKIRRDSAEEIQRPKHTCYKMYLEGELIGIADYRFFNTQSPYWYVDEFVIAEQERGKGYGSHLLNYIIEKMWNINRLPIHIYPTDNQIPKEQFIEWLAHRNFVEQPPLSTGQIFCILYPNNSTEVKL